MELKLFFYSSSAMPDMGSNCTFMELKFMINISGISSNQFKLYLYGIEILSSGQYHAEPAKFKLYLYGIEILIRVEE